MTLRINADTFSGRTMRFSALVPLMCMCTGIGLSTAGVLPAMIGLGFFAFGAVFGLTVAILIFFERPRGKLRHSRVFVVIALLPLAIAVPIMIHDLSYPLINDITTDLENPPAFAAALEARPNAGRDMAYPEDFKSIVREEYSDVRPLVLDESPEQVFQRIEILATAQSGWEIMSSDADKLTVEGEVTTFFFRFVDDFIIRVSDQEGKTRVDMRSKSRDGLVDAGANSKRIKTFLAELARE